MKTRSTSRNVLRFAGVTAAALTATLATSLPAQAAVDRTACGDSRLLQLDTNTGSLCFANAGIADVAIYGVHTIRPGNYRVTVLYQETINGDVRALTRDPGKNWESPMHKVLRIYMS